VARLEGAHRGSELVFREVLEPLIDAERHAVAGERTLVLGALREQEPPRAIAQSAQLFHAPREVVVQRVLEAVLALAVGGDEAEQGTCELAARVVAPPLAFHDEAAHRLAGFAVRELSHPLRFLDRDLSLEPGETALGQDPFLDLGRIDGEHGADAIGGVARHEWDLLGRNAAKKLDGVHGRARHVDAHGQRVAAAVVETAAFGSDAQAPFALGLCELAPGRSVLDHDREGGRHHQAEPE
jgi:hypothetical protein